jgi:hypothetical protein
MVVALPTEVTGPVKFAFVVTVAALPVTLPTIGAVTVKFTSVPTVVKFDPVTVDFKVVPVNVSASATILAVLAVVNLPFASTVNVGIDVDDP